MSSTRCSSMWRARSVRGSSLDRRDIRTAPRCRSFRHDAETWHASRRTAWIDEAEREVRYVEATSVDSISIGLGLVARIRDGAAATLRREKVADGVWMLTSVTLTGSGRAVLFLRGLSIDYSVEWFDYRPADEVPLPGAPSSSAIEMAGRPGQVSQLDPPGRLTRWAEPEGEVLQPDTDITGNRLRVRSLVQRNIFGPSRNWLPLAQMSPSSVAMGTISGTGRPRARQWMTRKSAPRR